MCHPFRVDGNEGGWFQGRCPWLSSPAPLGRELKGSVPQVDIVPLFGRLFRGRYKSLVVGAASAGYLRRVCDGCRRRGGEKDRVNMLD